jgi:Rps23 Pro-64 3,4-dihydroxylase Tpa1-like proline 4-hydroxylase
MEDVKFKKQYVMFDLEVLNDDIWYWDNVISYPEDLIKLIENLDTDPDSHTNIPKWQEWTASNNPSVLYGYSKMILSETVKNKSNSPKLNQKVLYTVNTLKMAAEMCYNQYINQHTSLDPAKYQLDVSYLPVRKWNANSYMGPHSDSSYEHSNLAFTTVTYLNENYEGGELYFPDHNITIKPKAGSLIMFPASFVHQVKPILSGVRYTSTNSINMI